MSAINRLGASNSAPKSSAPPPQAGISLLNAYALMSNLEDLLRKITDEQATQQSSTAAMNTTADIHELGEVTPGAPEGSTADQPSTPNTTMSLTQALRSMLINNANNQYLFAELQATTTKGSSTFLQYQLDHIKDSISQFQSALQQQADAEAHRSFWQKFSDGIKEAVNAVWNADKKLNQFIASNVDKALSTVTNTDVHVAEAAVGFAQNQVEGTVNEVADVVQKGIDYVKEGIHYLMEAPALALEAFVNHVIVPLAHAMKKDIKIDQDKLNLACEIIGAVIVTVVVTALTMGGGTAEAAAGEAGVEMANLGGTAAEGLDVAGEAAEAGEAGAEGAAAGSGGISNAEAAANAVKSALQSVRQFMQANPWSSRVFALSFNLQNTDFAQNVAKRVTSDPAEQAIIAGGINTGLSIVSAISGAGLASSAVEGSSANGLYSMANKLQLLDQLTQVPGQVGTAKWDFRLAAINDDMGNIQADLDKNEGAAQTSEAELNKGDDFFASLMKSVGDNIAAIAQIIPMASQAEADAMNNSHSA